MQFLQEMGVRRPVADPIILLGHGLSFQTSPTLCSNSTICWRTSSDEWTHKPQMSIFDRNAQPPANISRGFQGYTEQTDGHSPPSRSKLLKYAWLKSQGSMAMQPEHRGRGGGGHYFGAQVFRQHPNTHLEKHVTLSFRPHVLSTEAIGTSHCLYPFAWTHTGLVCTKVQSLCRDVAL